MMLNQRLFKAKMEIQALHNRIIPMCTRIRLFPRLQCHLRLQKSETAANSLVHDS